MQSTTGQRRRAIFEVLLSAAMWSTGGIFIKLLDWGAMPIAGVRSLIAGLVMAAYMLMRRIPYKLNARSARSAVALCGTFTLFVAANKLTTAANAIVLQFTSPVFIVVFSAIFRGKRVAKADVLTVAVTLLGISLFFLDQLEAGHLLGNVLGVGAGMAFACYYMSLEGASESERMSAIANANALTALISLPFILWERPELTATSAAVIAALGAVQLGIPYVLLAKAAEHCPPLACSLLAAVEPLLNPVWVLIFDGERPGVFALCGGVVVIGAISAWCVYNDRKEKAQIADGAA